MLLAVRTGVEMGRLGPGLLYGSRPCCEHPIDSVTFDTLEKYLRLWYYRPEGMQFL